MAPRAKVAVRTGGIYAGLISTLLFIVLTLAGCGGSDDALPSVVTATVNDRGPIFRSMSVELAGPAGVHVEYWSSSGPRLRVASSAAPVTSHEVALPRLRERTTYDYRIRVFRGTGQSDWVKSGSFTTGDLPQDIRAMTFTPTGTAGDPLVFLSVRSTFTGGVIVDAEGHVVWYGRTNVAPQGAARRANGNWVVLTNSEGLTEFSSLGEVAAFLPQANLPAGYAIHHAVTPTPSNTLLFTTLDPRTFNGTTLQGEAIWEWNVQSGSVTKRWSAFDFFDPAVDVGPRSVARDWFHANHLAVGAHGNFIMSFHFLDQVISIAPDFGTIEWRLGGVGSTYPVSPSQATSGQHSAREVSPNRILVFDNGFARADGLKYSRALELALDPTTTTVSTAWEYRPNPDIWATIISSARRMGNGNNMLTFGTSAGIVGATGPIAVHEVSPAGSLVWSLWIELPPGGSVFQGDPMQSIGGEVVVP
jgi:hypothetical protein